MTFTCQYCNSNFTCKKTLIKHQKQAKYCLDIRGEAPSIHSCPCGKEYKLKDSLLRHQNYCYLGRKEGGFSLLLDNYNSLINDFQEQINSLKLHSEKINIRNVTLNNLQPVTDEKLQEHLEHLTIDFIQDGAKGYASFANEYSLRNFVICTDKARKKIRYKDEYGDLTDDANKLAQRFFIAISERNTEILKDAYNKLHSQLKNIVSDGNATEIDVTGILSKATALQDILLRSQQAAKGEDDAFTQDFIHYLAKML